MLFDEELMRFTSFKVEINLHDTWNFIPTSQENHLLSILQNNIMKYRKAIAVISENYVKNYKSNVWEKNRNFNIVQYGTKSNQ